MMNHVVSVTMVVEIMTKEKMKVMEDSESGSRWQIDRCFVSSGVKEDQEKLEDLLHAGWEPFAVSGGSGAGYLYHFRRLEPDPVNLWWSEIPYDPEEFDK